MMVQGQITAVRETPTKYGSFWAIMVNNNRFSLGKKNYGVQEGTWVEFSTSKDAKGYDTVDEGSLKPMDKGQVPAGSTAPASRANAPITSAGGSTYGGDRQDSIMYQNSRTAALEFVKLLASKDLIDFGKAKGADKIAIVETYVDKYTIHMFEEVKNQKPTLADNTPKAATKAAVPEDEEFSDELPF